MALYVFNLPVSMIKNGVDVAQGRRNGYFSKLQAPTYYLFTDFPGVKDLEYFHSLGINTSSMLPVHFCYALDETFNARAFLEKRVSELFESGRATGIKREADSYTLLNGNSRFAAAILSVQANACEVYYYEHERLLAKEVYMLGAACTEYYITANNGERSYAKLTRRSFKTLSGEIQYDVLYNFPDGEKYSFPDGRLLSKHEFLDYVFEKLDFGEKDTIILDRCGPFDFIQPLFKNINSARLIAVLHSGHFFKPFEDTGSVGVNYEYYYLFMNADRISDFVVSTEEQKNELTAFLQEYNAAVPRISVIPVSGIDRLRFPEKHRRPFSLITASRINQRKRLDWLVMSVIKAREKMPEITLDIFGEMNKSKMGYFDSVNKLIVSCGASEYIRFMGYEDITDIYQEYEAYITASVWETLGLSIMEATASGTALIGLDVKYGNRLFIKDNKNGFLISFDFLNSDDPEYVEQLTDSFAEAIVNLFSDSKRLERFHEESYKIAEDYLDSKIQEKWISLLSE